MRFENHVSLVWDVSTFLDVVPITPSCHNHLVLMPPGVPVPKPLGLSIEMASVMAHPPGLVTGAHEFTSTVYHNHVWFALEGHDLGPVIMHVSVEPSIDLLMPMHILKASRKAKFKAGEVKANGKPVACCTMIVDAPAVTPMMACGDVPMPVCGTGTALLGSSLIVGMHWIDMAMGWADIAVSMLAAFLTNGISAGSPSPTLGESDLMPEFGGLVSALIASAGQEFAGYHGDASWSYNPVQGALADVGITVTDDGATGTRSVTASGRLGTSGENVNVEAGFTDHRGDHENPTDTYDVHASGGVEVLGGDYGGRFDHRFGDDRPGGPDQGGSADVDPPEISSPISDFQLPSWGDLPGL